MTQHPFSPPSKSEYTLGKDLNLLPFELFNHVKAGRLYPVDKDTGQPIPRPDALRIKKRLKEIKQEIKVLPLEKGKIDILDRGQHKEDAKRKLDLRATALQEEQDTLNEKLKAITDINSWTAYEPPEEPKHLIKHLPMDLMKAFDILQNALFKKSDVEQLNTTTGEQSPANESVQETQVEPLAEPVVPVREEPENYFRRIDADHWAIKFGDEVIHYIDHVDGFFYIARLLSNPGESISDFALLSMGNTNGHPRATALINEGLNIDAPSKQVINDKYAQEAYKKKYHQLQSDLDNAENHLERAEIEKDMSDLKANMEKRCFVRPEDKKAQANLTKRLDLAYGRIAKVAPILSEHLMEHIKTDKFKRKYTGGLKWDVTQ